MPTIQEEIARVKELIFGVPSENQINEGCGDVKPKHEKKHHGSYMAKQQLYNIAKKAQSVHDRLDDNEQLEDWMESKIAQMADNIDSVSNSFDYDEHEDHHEEEVITLDLGEEIILLNQKLTTLKLKKVIILIVMVQKIVTCLELRIQKYL